jgi:CRP-like cAMP-binding protein
MPVTSTLSAPARQTSTRAPYVKTFRVHAGFEKSRGALPALIPERVAPRLQRGRQHNGARMNIETDKAGASPLDRAHGLRLRGQGEQALRLAASILDAALDNLGAAALVARLLLEAGRSAAAGGLAARLVDASLRRGDLPGAFVAAQLARDAGDHAPDALRRIAAGFGKGSPRLARRSARPPALPTEVDIAPAFAEAQGAELLAAAEAVATRFLAAQDPLPLDAALPELPLFSTLEPPRLLRLLECMALCELDTGSFVLRQGEEGSEAFVIARGVVDVVRSQSGGGTLQLASLGPGAIFGEMALVSDAPRAASVLAAEPVQLLSIARPALEELAREDPTIGRELGRFCYGRMVSNLVRHSPVLSSVPLEQRKALVERFTSTRFEPGELLVRQGEEPESLFLIASGEVQVRSSDQAGERTVLAELGPGHVVGEISLVLRRPANADVVALHATVALALAREQFHEAIREHPALLRELYETAVAREQETRNVIAQRASDASDVVLV